MRPRAGIHRRDTGGVNLLQPAGVYRCCLMVEQPTPTAPGGAPAPQDDVLLATKLRLPRRRPGAVPRSRLADRLTEATARELTLVCAPAGFGKTTLVADWARTARRPVAWLSLDEGDNDVVRFWRYVAAALDQLHGGIQGELTGLLTGPRPVHPDAVTARLVNTLASASEVAVLVVDDYHVIDAPAVHGSLTRLLELLPPQLRVVLASRAEPPLPLGRWRARGQLAELRAADLAFRVEEAAVLLGDVAGAALGDPAVDALTRRTEGWAAGLQLAGLSLRDHPDPDRFVETFSAATATCSTTWPRRCWPGSPTRWRASCWRRRSWTRCAGRWPRRSPGVATARGCWSGSSGPTCSWSRSTTSVNGGATTGCSPTCSRHGSGTPSPAGSPSCTALRPRGGRGGRGRRPSRPSGTRWPPGTPAGRPTWSSGTSMPPSTGPRRRPWPGGWRPCRPARPARGPGCWPSGPSWRCSAAAWTRPSS